MRRTLLLAVVLPLAAQTPKVTSTGSDLPNGWKLSPVGRHVVTMDYVLNVQPAPDRKALVGLHSGFNPHGLVLVDPLTAEIVQRVPQKSAWLGLAWAPDGTRLYVSGGNGTSRANPAPAPVYVYDYKAGRLSEKPVQLFKHHLAGNQIYWSGLAHHPSKPILYAANRHTERTTPGHIVAFDTGSGERLAEIQVEVAPYDVVMDAPNNRLFVSNWASRSISVVDLNTNKVSATISVGHNPNDMVLGPEDRHLSSSVKPLSRRFC